MEQHSALISSIEVPVKAAPGREVITLLVTVKAYPAIARKSGESVCVAGVRIDTPEPEWIRIFPVGFRDLPREKQFAKYQVVQMAAQRGSTDRRSESFKPNLDTVRLGATLDTARASSARWGVLAPLAGATTTCQLAAAARTSGLDAPSLGLIKPARVVDLIVAENPEYRRGGEPVVDVDLFGNERELLEATPFQVHYRYNCAEPGCRGHEQSIIDWESGALARRNLATHTVQEAMGLHRAKFLDEMCSPRRDTYFYVGNQHQHPQSFMVLGVFWPPAHSRPHPTLDL
jgi:hypothetical protein